MKKIIRLMIIAAFCLSAIISQAYAKDFINGAGATFPYPLYMQWFKAYEFKSGIDINYKAVGSGMGIQQAEDGLVDFGATDAPIKGDDQNIHNLVMVPMVAGAVAIVYNVPGLKEVNLSTEVISHIFLGQITKWDDPAIQADNPGVNLPDMRITVVHRTDGSGTTDIFTNYLKINPKWSHMVGSGATVKWPLGIGGKGNDGIAELVRDKTGSIGYMEWGYAQKHNLPIAKVGNHKNQFIYPSAATIKSAMSSSKIQDDFGSYLTNAKGENAYPICGFTFLLVRKDDHKASHVIKFIEWAYKNGDSTASELHYVPLTESLKEKAIAKIKG